MHNYVALLRGVNVGGNAIIKMETLRQALTNAGFLNVRTYIQSGNVLFDSKSGDKAKLAKQLQTVLESDFSLTVDVALFTKSDWQSVITSAPKWWGQNNDWKHNLLVLTTPIDATLVAESIGKPKPEIEQIAAGKGVIYASYSIKFYSRSSIGKLVANPVYKQMTLRNYNTSTKLLGLLELGS